MSGFPSLWLEAGGQEGEGGVLDFDGEGGEVGGGGDEGVQGPGFDVVGMAAVGQKAGGGVGVHGHIELVEGE